MRFLEKTNIKHPWLITILLINIQIHASTETTSCPSVTTTTQPSKKTHKTVQFNLSHAVRMHEVDSNARTQTLAIKARPTKPTQPLTGKQIKKLIQKQATKLEQKRLKRLDALSDQPPLTKESLRHLADWFDSQVQSQPPHPSAERWRQETTLPTTNRLTEDTLQFLETDYQDSSSSNSETLQPLTHLSATAEPGLTTTEHVKLPTPHKLTQEALQRLEDYYQDHSSEDSDNPNS